MTDTPAIEPPLEPVAINELGLTPGLVVADFGAGATANWATKIAELVGTDGQVIMFDVRKDSLAAALGMARLKGITNCRGVWSNLEIYRGAQGVADNSLDAGVMVNVLSQSKHPKDILAEVHRMLKSGAKLLIIDWLVDTVHPLAPGSDNRMAAEYITTLTNDLGLTLLKQFNPGKNYWGLIVVKT